MGDGKVEEVVLHHVYKTWYHDLEAVNRLQHYVVVDRIEKSVLVIMNELILTIYS